MNFCKLSENFWNFPIRDRSPKKWSNLKKVQKSLKILFLAILPRGKTRQIVSEYFEYIVWAWNFIQKFECYLKVLGKVSLESVSSELLLYSFIKVHLMWLNNSWQKVFFTDFSQTYALTHYPLILVLGPLCIVMNGFARLFRKDEYEFWRTFVNFTKEITFIHKRAPFVHRISR